MADNQDPNKPSRREIPIPVKEWGGQLSAYPTKNIPPNAFALLRNCFFLNTGRIRTRYGSIEYHDETVMGDVEVVASFEFRRKADVSSKIIEATSDGKLYYTPTGLGNDPVLIGNLVNPTPTQVGMVMMGDKLQIADGKAWMEWDGTTLTNVTSRLPSIAPLTTGDILDVAATRSQLWLIDSNDYLYGSVFNNPADMTTTSAGATKMQIQYGDGALCKSLVSWSNSLIINKMDPIRNHYTMYWLKGLGTTANPYRVDPMFGDPKTPTAFVGRSAVTVGADVIGLTLDGVTTFSAINNFQEAKPGVISGPIDDMVKRINFGELDLIQGIFDPFYRVYMLAVPLDGANYATHVLVYDVDGDRWSYFDNWDVRSWVRVGNNVLFGTRDGRLVQTGIGDNDEGEGFSKEVVFGDNDFGGPDIVKLFKSCEVDIQHEGDYNINYVPAIDGTEIEPLHPALLKVAGGASLWDEFVWDEDYWDALGNTLQNILIMGRGKTVRHKFYNSEADQPFSLESLSTRVVAKDSGTTPSD